MYALRASRISYEEIAETLNVPLKPSAAAKDRLRDAVAREVGARQPAAWSWWERPLAVVLATSALFVAAATVGMIGSSPRPPLHIAPSNAPLDRP